MNILTHNPEQQLSVRAKAFLARPKKLYINGEFVDAAGGETFETEDPASGAAITEVSCAKKEDAERAAVAARDAFDKRWSTESNDRPSVFFSWGGGVVLEQIQAGVCQDITNAIAGDFKDSFYTTGVLNFMSQGKSYGLPDSVGPIVF